MLLVVHGGAGGKRPSGRTLGVLSGCLSSGYEILRSGGGALDAVEHAIRVLENSGLFNAGSGGNLQLDGVRRLDASIMEGKNLKAGAVAGIEGIKNPITAARIMMEMPHVMMTGAGAGMIAVKKHLEPLPEPDRKVRKRLEETLKGEGTAVRAFEELFSTVGAVARDRGGNLASGASTGGIAAMLPGRVGDTPVIGAGIYAENDFAAVSCTGTGEHIIRLSLAKEISMGAKETPLSRAVSRSLRRLIEIGGRAGVIAVTAHGRFILMHTTRYMAAGYANRNGVVVGKDFRRIEG
jgi:beta-aspartyl-peptidase (threonine type)